MDNLTHTAVGLFLSRIGLKAWTPRATAILLLAANAPDIDILAAPGGAVDYLHYHRHFTHSLAAVPLIAILPVAVVHFTGKQPVRWLQAWIAAMIAVLTHLLLDWTNIYGVRMLLPFSDRWLRLDITNVVDLWIWGVCLLALLGPVIARLVGSEITSGAEKVTHHGRGFAWFALAFILVYNGGRSILHARAVEVLDSRIYQGAQPLRAAAFPDSIHPLRWTGVVETQDFWATGPVDLLGEFDPTRVTILHKPPPEPAIEAALATRTFQEFLRFAQFPQWRVTPVPVPENGRLVQLFDLRFGRPPNAAFMAEATVDPQMHVTEEALHIRPRPR